MYSMRDIGKILGIVLLGIALGATIAVLAGFTIWGVMTFIFHYNSITLVEAWVLGFSSIWIGGIFNVFISAIGKILTEEIDNI